MGIHPKPPPSANEPSERKNAIKAQSCMLRNKKMPSAMPNTDIAAPLATIGGSASASGHECSEWIDGVEYISV